MTFTEEECRIISNALYVAKERFLDNARELPNLSGMARLADQFTRQAADAQRVYDRIANELGIAG
jgi:hypothetical protein